MSDEIQPIEPAAEPTPEPTSEPITEAVIETPEAKPEPDALTVSQKEFNAQYHKTKQLEREKAALQAQFEEKEALLATYQGGTQSYDATPQATDEPGDIQAQVSRAVQAAMQAQQQATQAQTEKAQQAATSKAFNERAAAYAASNPEYNKAIESAGNIVYPGHVQAAILESKHGAQLDHLLLSNPQVLNELEGLSASGALMRMGQLESQFSGKQKQESQAPAPFETGGGAGAGSSIPDDDVSIEELYKRKMAKMRGK